MQPWDAIHNLQTASLMKVVHLYDRMWFAPALIIRDGDGNINYGWFKNLYLLWAISRDSQIQL